MKIAHKIKSSELLNGSFWTIIGSGLSRALITIGTIFSSNFLGAEKFGEFSITRSTINLILVVAGLNIGTVLTKSIAEYRSVNPQKCSRILTINYLSILLLTVLLAVCTYLFSDLIAGKVLNNNGLSEHFKISSGILFFAIIFSLNEAIYRGLGHYKRLGIWQVLSSISFLVFVPLGAYYYNVSGAIYGYMFYAIIMSTVTFLDLYFVAKKMNFKIFSFNKLKEEFKTVKELTLPIFLSSILEAPIFWFAQVILITNSGMIANGVASALLQTRNLMLIVPGYISLVILPILSKNLSNNELYKKNFNKALFINALFSIVCILPMLLFPRFFLNIYGRDFTLDFNYWDSFIAYISVPIVVVSNVYQQSLIANNKGWNSFFISIIWNTVLILSTLIFCKYLKFGITGYMLALLFAIIVQMLLRFYYEKRRIYKKDKK